MFNFKMVFIGCGLIFLVGCSGPHQTPLFGKESDTLAESACEHCKTEPFYVDGRWL